MASQPIEDAVQLLRGTAASLSISATVFTPGPRVSLSVPCGSSWTSMAHGTTPSNRASFVRERMAASRRLTVAGARCLATSSWR